MELTTIYQLAKGVLELIKGIWAPVYKGVVWIVTRKDRAKKQNRAKDAALLFDKFLLIFETQGVPRPLIPRFAGLADVLSISQACSDSLLAEALTDKVICHVADRFGLAAGWLYGATERRYAWRSNYKDPAGLLEELASLLGAAKKQSKVEWDELLFVSNGKVPSELDEDHQADLRIIVLLRCQIDRIENIDVERVHVIEDDLPWAHAPARLYIKQVALLGMHLGLHVRGVICPRDEFKKFEDADLFPHQLAFHRMIAWHPDDYVARPQESVVAKQVEEAQLVRSSIPPECFERARIKREELGRADLWAGVI